MTCSICKLDKGNDFSPSTLLRGSGPCRACLKKNYYKRRAYFMEYHKKYYSIEKNFKKHRENGKKAAAKFNKIHPQSHRASRKLLKAVKDGKVVRSNICVSCKEVTKTQGHHFDYSKPLEVIWLCRLCHMRFHVLLRLSGIKTH